MEITEEIEKNRILTKISKRINITEYYDINLLADDKFEEKYGYWGFGFQNKVELRFYNDSNVLIQLKKLLSIDNQYYFLPIDNERRIFKSHIDFLDFLFGDAHLKAHIIIADDKLNWFLVKDNFNKLIGIGDFIKKRIKKMVYLKFDNEKLMHCTYDKL